MNKRPFDSVPKKIFLLCGLVFCAAAAGAQGKIVVHVGNFRNNKGICLVALHNSAATFAGESVPLKTRQALVACEQSEVVFDDVPAGTYAILVIHDANGNGRFDTNFLGIPKEGYGASQNKLPFAAAPKFDANKFLVTATTTVVNIRLRYLF